MSERPVSALGAVKDTAVLTARFVRFTHEANVRRTALAIAAAAFCVFAVTGAGRITASDEVTMYDLSRALLHGTVAVPEGATLAGPDGRFYSKNSAGQALLALPLVAAGEAAARASGLPPARQVLAARFVASFFNAFVVAALLGVFYMELRSLGLAPRASLLATAALGFTTPLWVYAKTFMAEPLQALGLLLALTGSARAAAGDIRGARGSALGGLIAVSAKLSMLPLALACLSPLWGRPPQGVEPLPTRARWGWPLAGLAIALLGHLLFNVARFGTPFETGYGAQATPSAYTTPLWVGLYGLLLSSGKGVLWFAPLLWFAPAGWRAMRSASGAPADTGHPVARAARGVAAAIQRGIAAVKDRLRPAETPRGPDEETLRRIARAHAAHRAAWGVLAAWSVGLLLYGTFEHWAGDGSFGPRYLVPLLPLAFLPVAFALGDASGVRRRAAWALAILGLLVQIGGVFIYFGVQMRVAGDYPYTRALGDPRFMSDSHFNPRFTPIVGHWRLLLRNLEEHRAGHAPVLGGTGTPDPRLGLSSEDQQRMLHAIDVWWLYARYAGVGGGMVTAAVWLLVAAAAWCGRLAWIWSGRERRAG